MDSSRSMKAQPGTPCRGSEPDWRTRTAVKMATGRPNHDSKGVDKSFLVVIAYGLMLPANEPFQDGNNYSPGLLRADEPAGSRGSRAGPNPIFARGALGR